MRRNATSKSPKPQTSGTSITRRALMGSGVANSSGIIVYDVKSADRKNVKHAIEIDTQTLEARCSCEHFVYRVKEAHITDEPAKLCKHLRTFAPTLLKDCAVNIGAVAA